MNLKRLLGFIGIMISLLMLFTACGRDNTINESSNTGEKQSITINGSTSVQPIAEELAKAYKENNPNATIDIQGGGSGVGIKSAIDGVTDIGMSSRELSTEEKSLKEFKIAVDGIAVIINPANNVANLTLEQIRMIYAGEITNWKEVGGNDAQITVVTREQGSGTRGAFIELTGLEIKEGDKKIDKTISSAITQGSTGAVMTTVAGDPNSIGFASYGSAREKTDIKLISVEGVSISEDALYSGEYKISRPFLMLTNNEPMGLSKAFIDFVLSTEGQEIVAKHGFLKAISN